MGFIEDFVLMIAKGYMPMSIMQSPWLRWMELRPCGQVWFPFHRQLICEHLLTLLQKTMEVYVFPTIS
jgi:hypothetical protein